MNKFTSLVVFLILIFIYHVSAYADIGGDLQNYFKDLGYASNVTNPAAFHGQQAGFYTGGSVVMRSKVRDVQLMQVTLPSYSSGCSGIDLFGGSISLLSREEIKNTLKSVLNNAVNYAATLTLETVSPMIAKNALYWKDFIDRMNQSSLNSCQLAESLVGGAWPKIRGAQERICQDIGTSDHNIFSSWAEGRQDCKNQHKMDEVSKLAKQDPRYKDLIFDEGNIVWRAIQKRAFLRNDPELAELFMTLSGTLVIAKDPQGNVQKFPYPAFGNRNDLIDALLNGKKAKIYHCDEKKECLYPSPQDANFDAQKAFKNKVAGILTSMATHVVEDKALTDEEKSLIASTNLPILQMIIVTSAYLKTGALPNIDVYAEVIAADILYQYLQDALNIVKESLAALPLIKELTQSIQKNIEESMLTLRDRRAALNKQVEITLQLIMQTQQIERMLIGEFSTELASTISWAKGMK